MEYEKITDECVTPVHINTKPLWPSDRIQQHYHREYRQHHVCFLGDKEEPVKLGALGSTDPMELQMPTDWWVFVGNELDRNGARISMRIGAKRRVTPENLRRWLVHWYDHNEECYWSINEVHGPHRKIGGQIDAPKNIILPRLSDKDGLVHYITERMAEFIHDTIEAEKGGF